MICYKGRRFCQFTDCDDKTCDRRLTDEIKKGADETGLSLDLFIDKPECYREEKNG